MRFGYAELEKEVEQEFAEKCGAIVDEFNRKAGLDQAKNVSGGIGAAKTSTSSSPENNLRLEKGASRLLFIQSIFSGLRILLSQFFPLPLLSLR